MEEIKKYINWIKDNSTNKCPIVINKDWEIQLKEGNIEKIEYIIVGDNPGIKEKKETQYFIGYSGQLLRRFLLENFNIKPEQYVIFNKTPIHTSKTAGLNSIENEKILKESMEKSAEIISFVSKKLEKPVLIFGKSNNIFKPFQNKLKELECDYLVYSHPSFNNLDKSYCNFMKTKFVDIKEKFNTIDNFLELGKLNM